MTLGHSNLYIPTGPVFLSMGIFDLFQGKDRPSLRIPSTLAVSIATLSATHQNAAKDLLSKKEQASAQQAAQKLAEARKGLHAIERALQVRDQEYAMHLVNETRKDLQEYCSLTAPIVKLEQVRKEVDAMQKRLVELENQVMIDRI